jgi:hypothetical protein
MNFFQAQKRIIYLWFFWGCLLMIYIAIGIRYGHYDDVLKELMIWLTKYLAVIFTLITGSNFFSKSYFEEKLKDIIYFRMAFVASFLYLLYISEILIIEPRLFGLDMSAERFIAKLDDSGQLLNFLLPVVTALLSYFFYKNKKESTTAEPKA